MGQFAPEEVHPLFSKKSLSDTQKARFGANDILGSYVMTEFDKLPPSREASLAKTKLEEAIFWANRSILLLDE